jgi:Tol biopolymer transport system component
VVVAATALLALWGAASASATFPGASGKIAFVSVRDGNQEIYLMNADGSGQTRLTFSPAADNHPSWSPDGSKIAFTSFRDGRYQLYVMNADGSNQHRVTNDPDWDAFPSWTADGRQLVFQKATFDASGTVNSIEIWAVNAGGGGSQRNLAGSPRDDETPATSPHGNMIAFNRSDGISSSLFVMRLDGAGLRQITSSPSLPSGDAVDFRPNWSPHGNKIVFLHNTEVDNEIYVVGSNGQGLTRLTTTPDRVEFSPVWSPDGSQIAFAARDRATGPTQDLTIYVMNSNGSGVRMLTNHGGQLDWQRTPTSRDDGSNQDGT